MSKLTRLLIVVACALIAALPMPVLAQKKPHIIVVTHGQVSDSFWVVVKNGVQLAAKETGANVEYRAPEKFDMNSSDLDEFWVRRVQKLRLLDAYWSGGGVRGEEGRRTDESRRGEESVRYQPRSR